MGSKAPIAPVKRLVSGGSDSTVKIWKYDDQSHKWIQDGPTLTAHSDWVRDVAWAPSLGLPMNTIASAGQDGRLIAWTEKDDGAGGAGGWEAVVIHEFGPQSPIWRVSWSTGGNVLAATDGSGAVTLWTEASDGQWQQVSA